MRQPHPHKDGGPLLLKRYAHVRMAHSQEQAKRVTFHAAPVRVVPASVAQAVEGILENREDGAVNIKASIEEGRE